MPEEHTLDLEAVFRRVRAASRQLSVAPPERLDAILLAVADAVEAQSDAILAANAEDLARMPADSPLRDRLLLTPERLRGMADGVRQVAALPSPLDRVLASRTLPNGLRLRKVSVPFGVIGVIYEARPNVTLDVFALCLKAGSACLLKGGHDADASNRAIVRAIHGVLEKFGAPSELAELLPPGREATAALLAARGWVDLLIPRGGAGLIRSVQENARVPVIETGAGVCHAYFDAVGDLELGRRVVLNAKTRRVSVCNALDCLLIHEARLGDLPALCAPLAEKGVRIHADARALARLEGAYPAGLLVPAREEDYGREFLSLAMAVKAVGSLDVALEHIAAYGSGHSESIVTEDAEAAERFTRLVDAACVYVNAPTSFTDGGEFGLGAEIGISTQKLHARGPMGLEEITTYKWLVHGEGQMRP